MPCCLKMLVDNIVTAEVPKMPRIMNALEIRLVCSGRLLTE